LFFTNHPKIQFIRSFSKRCHHLLQPIVFNGWWNIVLEFSVCCGFLLNQ
jgi:hypothetical protein